MLEVNNLTKIIKNKIILNEISFSIEKGKVVGLIGPNGSGKTTIMKHLAHIAKPTSGTISNTRSISYFMGDEALGFDAIEVKEYLNFIKDVYKKDLNIELLNTIINDFKLPLDVKIKSLSRGEKVKLELAVVLARDTDIYLLDEPFNGVDVILRELIIENILKYIDIENKIIIITSHELIDVEKIIDEIILINKGKMIDKNTIDSIRGIYNQDLLEYYKDRLKKQV